MRLGTGETLAFVDRFLERGVSVLEVGCGDGELAAELMTRGYQVTAIDSDRAALEEAKRRGVDAVLAEWPFRSAAACRRFLNRELPQSESGGKPPHSETRAILFTRSIHHMSPLDETVARAKDVASTVLIEDFALQEVSGEFTTWLRTEVPGWEPHDVHPFAAIRREVAKHFHIVHEESVPYCYRYFDPPDDRRIYETEIARGELLGRRLVGVA